MWDGDWEPVAKGEAEDPVILRYTCEDCGERFTGVYKYDKLVKRGSIKERQEDIQ